MDLKDKRILVIGGAGFIGSNIVEQLTQTDVGEIVVYKQLLPRAAGQLAQGVEGPACFYFFARRGYSQTDILDRTMAGIDGVFHLATLWLLQCHEYPHYTYDGNFSGHLQCHRSCH